ncbi:MAG: phosphoribosylanthranilate isomerase [Bacteroidales bacterium]|nr:phosphoribosylanthranilate isomerase [Bacteroidales bacterium]
MSENKLLLKICGLRDADNIREVAALNPDFMGFIFYPPSPRNISLSQTPESLEIPSHIHKTGVFVNASNKEILETAKRYGLNALQLHGNEGPEQCRQLRTEGYLLIKALPVSGPEDFRIAAVYEGVCDYLLFDTKGPSYGGSGRQFDRELLSHYRSDIPFFLSGGIGPGEAQLLAKLKHPRLAGLDINSRFETAPGLKDIQKLKAFIQECPLLH